MANASAAGTVWNCPNYVGELYLIGQNQTPVLRALGGLDRPNKTSSSFEFPVTQQVALETAAQPAITETASLTAPTPITYVRSQVVNTVQIFQKQVSISYAKQSNIAAISGLAITGNGASQPVVNEKDYQIGCVMRQIAVDYEYTIINGAYQKATSASVAAKTRGILNATNINTVAAGSAYLTADLVKQLLRTMAAAGSVFADPFILANAFQIQLLSDLFGFAPLDRTVGGVALKRLVTDFCEPSIMWVPAMPTTVLAIVDFSVLGTVFLPVPGKGVLFFEELAKSGASEVGQIYGQMGIDHGPGEYHGTITGLLDA